MAPAPIRKYHGVLAGPSSEVIREAVRTCSGSVGGVVYEGGVACEGDSDEVDEVVAGEGEGESKGAHQYHYFENIDFEPVKHLHQCREEDEEGWR